MKRPKGTGSTFQRGKVWFIQYFSGPGDRHRECSHSEDRKVAEDLLVQRLAAVATGQGVPLARVTMGTLIDLVLADYAIRQLPVEKAARWVAGAHFEDLRKIAASKFGPSEIQRYIAGRRNEGAENSTINRELAILRRGFTLGQRESPPLVHRVPYIPTLKEDNVRQGFLVPEDYEKVLVALPQRLKAFFVCGYHLGTRKGELRKVRWEQVDWEAMVIRMPGKQTKTRKPRTLPIYGDMERWLRTQQETCLPDCPWVFHYQGSPIGIRLCGWQKACEAAGLGGLHFHDLRRSAVRNMQRAGIPIHVSMQITGHRTQSMFKRYDIVDEADIDDAGEKMKQYFEKRKAERAAPLRRVK